MRHDGFPIPGQEFVNFAHGRVRQFAERVREPCLRVDVVEFCGDDERVHEGGAIAAALRAGE